MTKNSKKRIKQSDILNVLVVPMEHDRDIYQMELHVNGNQLTTFKNILNLM